VPIKAQQNESGLSQHEQGSLTSMSDRLLGDIVACLAQNRHTLPPA